MKFKSLSFKILAVLVILTGSGTMMLVATSSWISLQQVLAASTAGYARTTGLLAESNAGNIKFGKTDALQEGFAQLHDDGGLPLTFGLAFRADGTRITEPASTPEAEAIAEELVAATIDDEQVHSRTVGTQFYVAAPAHFGKEFELIGAMVLVLDLGPAIANAWGVAFQIMGIAVIASVLALGGLVYAIRRMVSRPIEKLDSSMRELAEGNLDVEVTGARRQDELGAMARTVEVFRENANRMREMSDQEVAAEQRRQDERAKMMQDLQRSFGAVVDAAIAGDFSRRVDANFPDEELNALARSVNDLVETVDRGIAETGGVLAALAHTDLTHRVTGSYDGAFDKLKTDTNAVADKLVEIVGRLKQTSRGVKTATVEILSGANDLSERTTKQAATIEETSAAMEQLANTVLENAKRAGAASEQAETASRTAQEGGEVMGRANQAMERISSSSAKISNIIGMIDDIAFQTNLLALNASVEAARAGEAGKGFAVVAVEVRRLAQSAAEASSEVKALIEQSGEEVSGGTRLVAEAAEKLGALLEAVKANATQMGDIAKDSREQASAIEEVNTAVRQMDEMTQHNAALVEETNAAIEQTEAQATELDRIVEVFTLDEAERSRSPAEPAKPAKPASGIKKLQNKVASAAKTYLSKGNTAVKPAEDWSEF